MANYDRLYDKIDEVFRGTPNTPSALAIKSEIIENLTIKYDELLADGISESEAIDRVVDSIGDLDELFGTKKTHAPSGEDEAEAEAGTQGEAPKFRTLTAEEEAGIWKRKKLRTFAIVLYIISILPNILIGTLFDPMTAEALMFTMWAVATGMMVGAGAYSPGVDATKRKLIGAGVGMYIFAFVPMYLFVTTLTMIGISLMFVGWALATALVILGASRKSNTVKIDYDKKAEHDGLDKETRAIYKRIKLILELVTLCVYLWFSFTFGGWVYSWLIWIINGCICDAVKALLVMNAQKEEKK